MNRGSESRWDRKEYLPKPIIHFKQSGALSNAKRTELISSVLLAFVEHNFRHVNLFCRISSTTSSQVLRVVEE
jgi:hypothetical protein